MEDSVQNLAEVKVDNVHCSPFIDPSSHAVVEDCQTGQAWFTLGKSMLTIPDYLLFFCIQIYKKTLWRVFLLWVTIVPQIKNPLS